jgi:hypothetical protein
MLSRSSLMLEGKPPEHVRDIGKGWDRQVGAGMNEQQDGWDGWERCRQALRTFPPLLEGVHSGIVPHSAPVRAHLS